MLETKAIEPGSLKLEDSGSFSLAFSPIDVVDLDGDIVRRSAIPDGIKLPLMQSHRQSDPPVGIGTVSHSDTHAILTGSFIDSTAGRDAHATVKATAEIQELSWGFSINEAQPIVVDGKQVREITQTTPHEVSLVLRGAAGPGNTGVLSVKEDGGLKFATEAKTVHAAVLAFKGRAGALAALRADDGRELSQAVKSQLLELCDEIDAATAVLKGLCTSDQDETDLEEFTAHMRALELRYISERS